MVPVASESISDAERPLSAYCVEKLIVLIVSLQRIDFVRAHQRKKFWPQALFRLCGNAFHPFLHYWR